MFIHHSVWCSLPNRLQILQSIQLSARYIFGPMSPVGVARLAFTARIERAHFHRARSASKKGTWLLSSHLSKPVSPSLRGRPAWAPTARNYLTRPPIGTPRRAISPSEGLLRPRIARAQEANRPHYLPSRISFPPTPPFLSRVAWSGPSPRASREHILIVRTLRAKGTIQATLPRP